MRWLLISAMLMAAVPLEQSCRTVKVNGPKTKDCPEGVYIVTADQEQNPPVLSYRCEKPAPSPSVSPSVPPSPPPASPSPEPSASPSPSPTPKPTPSATPAPSPTPKPGFTNLCPAPIRTKIALFSKRKLEEARHTWRNVWNVTPIVPSTGDGGSCEWKRSPDGGLPDECEAANTCAEVYAKAFAPIDPAVGIPQAYQAGHNKDGSSFSHDSVERSSTSDYLLVITDAGQGPAKLCASFPNLDSWRCTQFFIDANGEAVGAEGNDRDKSHDEAK